MTRKTHFCGELWLQAIVLCLITGSYSLFFAQNSSHAQSLNASAAPMQNTIVGRVWKDANSDGLYQLDEPFLPYTEVALYMQEEPAVVNAAPLLTTTTTITGGYAFRGLAPGTYLLQFTTVGSMFPTGANQGNDDTIDNDVITTGIVTQARSQLIQTSSSSQQWVVDAGFVLAAQVTVYVYDDTNRDNNRQMSEPVVLGAVVLLQDNSGREVRRQAVDQKGAALFTDLPPGEYAVAIWPPEGYSEDPRAAVALALVPGAAVRLSAPIAAAPKVVNLTSFTVDTEGNQLAIRWLTGLEQETYGFRVLRRTDVAAATTQQLTVEIIPSLGTQGGRYEVRVPYNIVYDGPVTAMEFWLVEYEVSGRENLYGPFYTRPMLAPKAFLPLVVAQPQ